MAKDCIRMILEGEAETGQHITTFQEPTDANSLDATGETDESDMELDPWFWSFRPRRAPLHWERRREMRAAAEPSRSSQFSHHSRSYDNSAWSSTQQRSWYMGDGRGLAVVSGNDGVASFPTNSQNCQLTADHHAPLPTLTNHTTYYPTLHHHTVVIGVKVNQVTITIPIETMENWKSVTSHQSI